MAWLQWELVKVEEFITVTVYRISRGIESLADTRNSSIYQDRPNTYFKKNFKKY